MTRILYYILLLLCFFSCSNNEKPGVDSNPYRISQGQLKVDTAIRAILPFNGYYLCLQENLKIAVFDSNLVRKKSIEDSLNIFPIAAFNCDIDTVFLFKDEPYRLWPPENGFYFTNNFKIKERKYFFEKSSWWNNGWPLYEDSIYKIYSNHIGAGGLLVFFYNKNSKKTYSTWSFGPRQVLKFNNCYYLAEEGDYKISPKFRIISDPADLINIPDGKAPGLLQLFQHLAPFPGEYYEKLADSIKRAAAPVYGNAQNKFQVPVYTFIKENRLYTIIRTDSSIYLAAYNNDSLVKVQTILDSTFEMGDISYSRINKNHFITFQASGGKTIENKMQHFSTSGFILIRDTSIEFNYYHSHQPYDE